MITGQLWVTHEDISCCACFCTKKLLIARGRTSNFIAVKGWGVRFSLLSNIVLEQCMGCIVYTPDAECAQVCAVVCVCVCVCVRQCVHARAYMRVCACVYWSLVLHASMHVDFSHRMPSYFVEKRRISGEWGGCDALPSKRPQSATSPAKRLWPQSLPRRQGARES